MNKNGSGVPQDYEMALSWYHKAAEQGETNALIHLGEVYATGRIVPPNTRWRCPGTARPPSKALPSAQVRIGNMYAEGQGVLQDNAQAHMWYNLASAQDFPLASEKRDRVAAKMTPAQISEAQKLAREWKPKPER